MAPAGERRGPPRETLRLCWELVAARRSRGVVPLAALTAPDVLRALARLAHRDRALRVVAVVELAEDVGVRAVLATARAVVDAAAALADVGCGLDVWPQLPDGDRFLNTTTARRFHERLLPLLHAVAALAPAPQTASIGLFLDVEPALATREGAWTLGGPAPWAVRARGLGRMLGGVAGAVWDARQGRRDLRELARDVAALPFAVLAAVPPPMLPLDAVSADVAQSWLLGCPVDDDDGTPLFARTAALCYAPLLQRRGDERASWHGTLSLWAARHRERGDAICLGPTSTGVLGDEPTYDVVDHLRHDLLAVRALGFDDITLHSLEGLLFGRHGDPDAGLRDDVELWLAALQPSSLPPTMTAALPLAAMDTPETERGR
jgi:hypothetical protein